MAGGGLTQQVLGRTGHRVGIEGREHPALASPHVEATKPKVILFSFHQHGVIHVQLQFVWMPGDEPEVG